MLSLVMKIMILIMLHIICNVMIILTGAIETTDFLDFFYSETVYNISFFANIIFYQVYIYLNYRIKELRKLVYKVVYWVFNFVGLGVTLWLWLPSLFAWCTFWSKNIEDKLDAKGGVLWHIRFGWSGWFHLHGR